MPVSFPTAADMIRFLPETILTAAGTLLMVLDPILRRRSSNAFGHISLLALLAATKGASYRMSEPEVKAALTTARVAKRKRAPNLCGTSVFETRCGVFVVDIV